MTGIFQYEKKDRGTILFHKDLAPRGKKFDSGRAAEIEGRDGWVDSPAKFTLKESETAKVNHAVVDEAVNSEKAIFLDYVTKQVAGSKVVAYNEAFMHFSGKELSSLAMVFGAKKGLDLRKNIDTLRDEVRLMIKAHNEGLEEQNG